MKKFALIEMRKNADSFEKVFDTEAEAIAYAERKWDVYLTNSEKKLLEVFAVMAGELDEDECFDINSAELIREWKA